MDRHAGKVGDCVIEGVVPGGSGRWNVTNSIAVEPDGAALGGRVARRNADQDQEYIQLINGNSFAVDISEWTLGGAVNFRFKGGTVIPAAGSLYVAANRKAFRARTSPPMGNQGLYVVGDGKA